MDRPQTKASHVTVWPGRDVWLRLTWPLVSPGSAREAGQRHADEVRAVNARRLREAPAAAGNTVAPPAAQPADGDGARGYRHALAFRQLELSDTHAPSTGPRPDAPGLSTRCLISCASRRGLARVRPQLQACQCAPDVTQSSRPAPGLRFGEPTTMTTLACLCSFRHLIEALTNLCDGATPFPGHARILRYQIHPKERAPGHGSGATPRAGSRPHERLTPRDTS